MIPNERYLFVVIAFDRKGRYTQVFSLEANMLRFRVGFVTGRGPVLTMIGPGLNYRYPQGGYCDCPQAEIPTKVPNESLVTFRWFAEPGFECQSPPIRWYRWALDIDDVTDQTPRTNELTDLARWSVASLDATSATLGPFAAGEIHRQYIEAEDFAGVRSLGIVRFETVGAEATLEGVVPSRVSLRLEPGRGNHAALTYSLPSHAQVSIAVYDIVGRRVAVVENAARNAGTHRVEWDRSSLAQGVYFYRLHAGPATVVKSLVLLE